MANNIFVGSSEISGVKVGTADVTAIYKGSEKIWPISTVDNTVGQWVTARGTSADISIPHTNINPAPIKVPLSTIARSSAENDIFTIDTDGVRVSKGGLFLIINHIAVRSPSYTATYYRNSTGSRIYQNGIPIMATTTATYSRNATGHNEDNKINYTIVELDDNDLLEYYVLNLITNASDTNNLAVVSGVSATEAYQRYRSSLTVIKLNAAHPYIIRESDPNLPVTTDQLTVADVEVNRGYSLTLANSDPTVFDDTNDYFVTVNEAGNYLVVFNEFGYRPDPLTNDRSQWTSVIRKSDSQGDLTVRGSFHSNYIRGAGNNENCNKGHTTGMGIAQVEAGGTIRITAAAENSARPLYRYLDSCRFAVVKLPDDMSFISVLGTTQQFGDLSDTVLFTNTLFSNGAKLSNQGNDIMADVGGEFLYFGGVFYDQDVVQRVSPCVSLAENGTRTFDIACASYSRDADTSQIAHLVVAQPFSLTVGRTVWMLAYPRAATATSSSYGPNSAFTALCLDDLKD